MRVAPALDPEHGSSVITRYGVLGIIIGIPRPPELLPIIPKYVLCSESPWSRGASAFCRVLERYGPLGVSGTLAKIGFKEALDGIYNSPMPYVRLFDVIEIVKPKEALHRVLSKPVNDLHYALLNLLSLLSVSGVDVDNVGLTGSLAMRIENVEVSDLDLVVYGLESAEAMYRLFTDKIKPDSTPVKEFGGLIVEPGVNLGWRRASFRGFTVGWVGVPGVGELCEPLERYFAIDGPIKPVEIVVDVRGGQPSALTYPPCVPSSDGTYIVSFEYNVGALLYRGGTFRIKGLAGGGLDTIYIATRELPGYIRLLQV
jgi:predicted nucleotidyltransferase